MMMSTTMVMVMAVMMIVAMRMIVVVTVMTVGMRMLRVSAALRIERRLDRHQSRAQRFQRCFERAVGPHAQPVGENLHRHVAVAEMPGKARQMREIAAANLDEGLGLDHHIDEAAVIELQRVAVAQQQRLGKHRADLCAVHAGEVPGLQPAPLRIQEDGVDVARIGARRRYDANDA